MYQLLVLLKYIGTGVRGGSRVELAAFFGTNRGNVLNLRNRALRAVLSLRGRAYRWPSEPRRRAIADAIE